MNCYHIHIDGRVQGVGFRPFIYRIARENHLKGWISNTRNGVHIEAEGEYDVQSLCDQILARAPAQSRIRDISYRPIPVRNFTNFSIVSSRQEGETNMELTPDFAICGDCRRELMDPADRRSGYPFITCTHCGPRFSIIQQLPYDRHLTTMHPIVQCETCQQEFLDPENRRFYSQTNSCPECPVRLKLYDSRKKEIDIQQGRIIEEVAGALIRGDILAVKGIGGYLLLADATRPDVIQKLRVRKRRPSKPFALMYPDQESASLDVILTNRIVDAWFSPESPIVLCKLRKHPGSGVHHELVAPSLKRTGIMMPYAPLFELLMHHLRKPLIATSGNVSGSPIIYRDEEALEVLCHIADLIVTHNREIVVPQDDSVLQFTEHFEKKIILRRSRGLAPSFQFNLDTGRSQNILAMGAMLKSTFAMKHRNRYYISQYLGDTSTLESQESYQSTLGHMSSLLGFSPEVIQIDEHPDYPASALGREMATSHRVPVMKVQHHEAHSLAVIAENGLLDEEKVLSVIWDGTGYGKDGNVWGGEFFEYNPYENRRVGHWEAYPHILGDKMSLEPRVSAFCLTRNLSNAKELLEKKFTKEAMDTYSRLISGNRLTTSSVGRMFDGVAAILDLNDQNTFEGEAAMHLEARATEFFDNYSDFDETYSIPVSENGMLGIADMMGGIVEDRIAGLEVERIAAKFHLSLVKVIKRFMEKFGYEKAVFSGGVFQNALLTDLILMKLNDKFSVYFQRNLSPNDECVAFGQIIACQLLNYKEKK